MNDTLEQINQVILTARTELDGISMETESLAKDISGIVISMQFQDITRQKIEHVIDPLQALRSESMEMLGLLESGSPAGSENGSDSNIAWLEDMYTMESEREIMKQALSKTDSHAAEAAF